MITKYVFILCPPYSGSTLLWKLLSTSSNVSALPHEGQKLPETKEIMRDAPWNPDKKIPWKTIKEIWESYWDKEKIIHLEKSPPNIIRAKDLQEFFSPTFFIAMIRNPYALCEGLYRRSNATMIEAANAWVTYAQYQKANIEQLNNLIFFKYEDLTEKTPEVKAQISKFLPELIDIDTNRAFHVHSIDGLTSNTIMNFNDKKIAQLSPNDINTINAVLNNYCPLMGFFNYQYISPEDHGVT